MEVIKRNIMINKVGGNASKGSLNYRVSIPTPWMQEWGISEDNRAVKISFDGDRIVIEKEDYNVK